MYRRLCGEEFSSDDVRARTEDLRYSASREADQLKDPTRVVERLSGFSHHLDADERRLADQVLAIWALAEDESKRYDAVSLIGQYGVVTAEPELRAPMARLGTSNAPGAPSERDQVGRLLDHLGRSEASSS